MKYLQTYETWADKDYGIDIIKAIVLGEGEDFYRGKKLDLNYKSRGNKTYLILDDNSGDLLINIDRIGGMSFRTLILRSVNAIHKELQKRFPAYYESIKFNLL